MRQDVLTNRKFKDTNTMKKVENMSATIIELSLQLKYNIVKKCDVNIIIESKIVKKKRAKYRGLL